MSAADWTRPPENIPPPRAKESGARKTARKRRAQPLFEADEEPLFAPAPLAGFFDAQIRTIDAEKWPVYPVIWWEPELPLQIPPASGLRHERRYKIPVAGFRDLEITLRPPAGTPAAPDAPRLPELSRRLPASDVTPLGWDARAASSNGKPHVPPASEGDTE